MPEPYTTPTLYCIDPAMQYPGDGAILLDMLRSGRKRKRRRERYRRDPSAEIEYARRWREAHPGYRRRCPGHESPAARARRIAYDRRYYAEHREEICARRRERYWEKIARPTPPAPDRADAPADDDEQ